MICFAKPVLSEDLIYIAQKEKFSVTCPIHTLGERPSIFTRGNPIFSSERMLHKDYYRKGSVGKKNLWS
jgi:hypothetical protein